MFKRAPAGLFVAAFGLLLACNLAAAAQTPAPSQAEQELTRLVYEECEGVLENHEATLARIWAEEFIMHTTDGRTTPKRDARAYLITALPQKIIGLCEIKDLKIKVSGRKATTEGRMRLRGMDLTLAEAPVQYKFSQRLVRRDGRWQVTYLDFGLDQP
ncbi:MAG TPA: nuclear transport factor 2 family protein [Pyrinomonadaceae bacterium]|jgi:hypothetical protein